MSAADANSATEANTAFPIVRASRQRRLLTEPALYEEDSLPGFVRLALLAVAALVGLFMLWSAMVHIDEVAMAPGQIVPSGAVKVVQHLEGGIVAEVLVTEGAMVRPGETVLRMDPTQALGELRQMKARRAGLLIRSERLRAVAEDREPDFARYRDDYPGLVADQRRAWSSQADSQHSARVVVDKQSDQREKELRQLRAALDIARQHFDLASQELAIREKGVEHGIVSMQTVLETRRALVTAEGEVRRLEEQVRLGEDALSETLTRRANLGDTQREDALGELATVSAETAQVENALARLEDRVRRLEVVAPTAGIVQDLKVRTAGEVVQPGALLMKVVPRDDVLEAEVRISTRDIGHVAAGEPVKLKVSTYEFTRYGAIPGELVRISPTTFLDEQGKPYYRGVVRLERSYMGPGANEHPIQPGMNVDADIVTGTKTLLQYLLKPIHLAFRAAFHER